MNHRTLFEADGELTVKCKADESKAVILTDGTTRQYEILEFSDGAGFNSDSVWLCDRKQRKICCLDLRSVMGVQLEPWIK